jgi:hypothetical protein
MSGKRDRRVQHTASLHENAVQAIAEGKVGPTPRKARKGAQKRSQAVHTHIQWPAELWSMAQAAVRPGERLVIVSETEARTVYVR